MDHFLGPLCSGEKSLYPPRKGENNYQKVFIAPGSRQLSEVFFQVFKKGTTHVPDSCFREWLLSGVIFGICFTVLTNISG
jgi:hypothetical protein